MSSGVLKNSIFGVFWKVNRLLRLTTISFGSKLGKECLEVVIEKGNLGGGANKLELSAM